MFIRETYIAGQTIVFREKMKRVVAAGQKREPKARLTTEKVWANNLRYAIFRLTLILNSNFKPGDQLLTLTYADEPTMAEAEKMLRKFQRAFRGECKKAGIDLKRVSVTERKGARLHHHIVCSDVPISIVKRCWPHGTVFHKPLWDYPNYADLASYLLKQAAALHMEEGDISKKRYTTSRNIVVPEGKEEVITRRTIEDEIKPLKGYQIDQDSVHVYENELLDTVCREYIMVSTSETPRLKRWKQGTNAKGERINYSKALREAYREVQGTIDELFL